MKIPNSRVAAFILSQELAGHKGLLLHAAAVIRKGRAYLFLGQSGAGKTTVAKLSERLGVQGDDIIAVRKECSSYYSYATPWPQSRFLKPHINPRSKIKAVFFIRKAQRIHFQHLKKHEALVRLLHGVHFVTYTPKPLLKKVFTTAVDFANNIPAYEMAFSKDGDFWPALDKAIG